MQFDNDHPIMNNDNLPEESGALTCQLTIDDIEFIQDDFSYMLPSKNDNNFNLSKNLDDELGDVDQKDISQHSDFDDDMEDTNYLVEESDMQHTRACDLDTQVNDELSTEETAEDLRRYAYEEESSLPFLGGDETSGISLDEADEEEIDEDYSFSDDDVFDEEDDFDSDISDSINIEDDDF